MGDIKLPDTKDYRVVIVGASYRTPAVAYDDQGQEVVVHEHRTAGRGEVISLTPAEARRLEDLGAIRSADASDGDELAYEDQPLADLHDLAAERGLEVAGTGKGGNVLKEDLVAALRENDAK